MRNMVHTTTQRTSKLNIFTNHCRLNLVIRIRSYRHNRPIDSPSKFGDKTDKIIT